MMVGPVWIGMYDPGHTNFLGCFVLIMEEALASKSMVGYVEKSIWARKQKLAGNNSGATQASPMSNRQVLQDIVSSSQHSNLLLSLNEHSQNPHARLHIPTDKSERSRRLLEQAQLYEKNKKRFLNQGRTYRGILTHAVEGDKKGYHVQWKISTITSTHVSGVFSIMLVSCKNGDAATLKTFPCKLNLSMKISEIVNLDEFSDIRTVLKSLNQQSFLDEVLLVAPSVSDGIAAVNPAAEEDVQAVVSNATQTPTVASSEELFSHFENSQFSRIVKSTTSASDDEQLATSSSPSTNTNSINNDVTATSTTIDSEDEAIETQWLSEHIPLDSQISLVRLGSVLAGFFNAPKVGVFYLSIQ